MCVAHAVADAVEATEVLLLWVETSRELGLFPGDTKGLGPDSLPCNNVCNTAFRNNETTSGCTGKTEYSHYHTHRGAHVTDGDPPPSNWPTAEPARAHDHIQPLSRTARDQNCRPPVDGTHQWIHTS